VEQGGIGTGALDGATDAPARIITLLKTILQYASIPFMGIISLVLIVCFLEIPYINSLSFHIINLKTTLAICIIVTWFSVRCCLNWACQASHTTPADLKENR
jgi:CDP-diglyceride synthetase